MSSNNDMELEENEHDLVGNGYLPTNLFPKNPVPLQTALVNAKIYVFYGNVNGWEEAQIGKGYRKMETTLPTQTFIILNDKQYIYDTKESTWFEVCEFQFDPNVEW